MAFRSYEQEEIGDFELKSPRLIVSDPCYERDAEQRIHKVVENCLPGTWVGSVTYRDEGSWGMRIAVLRAEHQTHLRKGGSLTWEYHPKVVLVDSGQAGIFDDSLYQRDGKGEYGVDGTWYGEACKLTHSEDENRPKGEPYFTAGILEMFGGPLGIVSSSGYGDGAYELKVGRNSEGVALAVEVVFIEEEDEEDYDDDDAEADSDTPDSEP